MKIKRAIKWTFLILVVVGVIWFQFAYWTSSNDCETLGKAQGETMKAIVYCDYGTSDVLKVMDIPKPVPKDNQVLVRVRATSVNPYDWHFVRGTPYIMRLGVGLRKPKDTRLGVDFSGTVEAVGKNVTQFKPGDEVFGGKGGAFAQYICIAEKSLALKPANISFEQAGTIQIAGMTALQGLRNKAKIQPGQKVLINGASGGVGTYAVQIAKALGAEVTGVCSGRNVELVKSLGADHVIDYTKEDFAKTAERYDAILDNVPNHSLSDIRQILTPKGKYVMIGGGGPNDGKWIGPMGRVLHVLLLKPFVSQEMGMMMAETTQGDMNYLRELMEAGKLKPVLDRTYKSLSELPAALAYLEQGHARGKVAITVD
jgi:NADPH:quinone reductase-like Zn-dependent oxidoreductase